MADRKVQLEIKNKIGLVTMNRTRKKIAFDESNFTALEQVTDDLKQIVINGDGNEAFCAGIDVNPENFLLAAFLEVLGNKDIEPARRLVKCIRKTIESHPPDLPNVGDTDIHQRYPHKDAAQHRNLEARRTTGSPASCRRIERRLDDCFAIHDALSNQRLHKCFINLFRRSIPMAFVRCAAENGDKIPGILPGG